MPSRFSARFPAAVLPLFLALPLLEAARREQAALIDSLQDMVQIASPSSNAAGLARMADYTERRLRQLGANIERRKGMESPGDVVTGTFHGTGSRCLMLTAHMDTVYPVGTLKNQPYRIGGNRIYGPGIADDKGGISVVLHSLKIMPRCFRQHGQYRCRIDVVTRHHNAQGFIVLP